jgi:hypothetical protein
MPTNHFDRNRVGTAASLAIASVLLTTSLSAAQDDFNALIQQAREAFQPVRPEQLAAARAALDQRMGELERFVRPSTSNGQRWLRYLRWDALRAELANEGPPRIEVLDVTLERLQRNENGLELRQFRRLAEALERYRNLVAVSLWDDPAELYGRQLDALQRTLEAYRSEPTPANESALGGLLGIVDDIGQAPDLVSAIRQQYARPNAFIDVSTALVAASTEPVSRGERITDHILGTQISGDAHTTGVVEVASIPGDERAILQFRSSGHSTSHNVGFNGPAIIHSTGNTDFTAIKRVELSDEAFVSLPAEATAINHTDIHSIAKRGGGLGSRIVANQGWQRARQNQGLAEAIAADHAEERIERRFNRDVNEQLHDARRRYEEEYREPLARRGALPGHIRFSSDEDSLSVESTQASPDQLGAPGEPPPAPTGHDLTVRLHETAVANYSATMMGGATATQTEEDTDPKFDIPLPEWMDRAWQQRKTEPAAAAADEEPFKEWSMTFGARPISVVFDEGRVKLTTHVERLKSGDQTFSDWDITAIYIPELAGGSVVLRREGDLEMLPADFRGSLSSRQTAERRNLEKEINQRSAEGGGFPRSIEIKPIEPEGALADAGPLAVNEFVVEDGWLTIAWDRQRGPRQASR